MEGNLTERDFVTRLMNEPDETRKGFHCRLGRFITISSKTGRISDTGYIHGFRGGTLIRASKLSTIMEFYNNKKIFI